MPRQGLDPGRVVATAAELADAVHAIRGIRGALHGFVAVERMGGFALDVSVDESFERLVAALAAGLGQSRSA